MALYDTPTPGERVILFMGNGAELQGVVVKENRYMLMIKPDAGGGPRWVARTAFADYEVGPVLEFKPGEFHRLQPRDAE